MIRRRRLPLVAFAALFFACAEKPSPPAEVVFRVHGDGSSPISGAVILVDGKAFGTTDAEGALRGHLPLRPNLAYDISHECPKEMRAMGKGVKLRVDAIVPLAKSAGKSASFVVELGCAPSKLRHVVLVRTRGRAGLPIRILGREAGVTDADGAAMLVVDGAQGEEIEIAIDTSAAPRLRPASPSRRMELPNARRFLVFDQEFEERAKPRTRSTRPKRFPKRL